MPVAFPEYLAAKFALDERSLNREVRAAFLAALRGLSRIRCLDAGAGTGATARRLLASGLTAPLSVTALDRDASLLERARADIASRAAAAQDAQIRFVAEELANHRPDHLYNVVTAHAFLDIVPLAPALRLFAGWLEPGGYLYATLNYDGATVLADAYEDEAFEAGLLDYYNQTMESRRVYGQATGGAYSGRRLLALLPEPGFTVLAQGRSDWDIEPVDGRYRDDDAVCMTALLEMIFSEGERSRLFDPAQLSRWYDERRRLIREGRLALHVQQVDVLARYDR